MRSINLLILKLYSVCYHYVKHKLGRGNLRGWGLLSRKLATNDTVLVVNGRKLFFDHRAVENYLCLLGGNYNEPETHIFVNKVIDSMEAPLNFIDVGANVGEMVVDFANNSSISRIYAFEPSALCVSIINKHCELNGYENVEVIQKGVGEEPGSGVMPEANGQQFATAVTRIQGGDDESHREDGVFEISTLDAELDMCNHHSIMLIDVEGWELMVMRGGRKFIRENKPLIIFEYHKFTRESFSLEDVRNELGSEYEIFRLRGDGYVDKDLEHTWNCVAVNQSSAFYNNVQSLGMT